MKDNALYLEADEDITSAIDKLKKVPSNSVQIVVPKRSTLLQSVINQKLLKKAAQTSGKNLIIVTGDRVAIDLAARVGLAVAPSLGADAVMAPSHVPAPVLADDVIEEEPLTEAAKPVTKPATSRARQAAPVMATRELTEDESAEEATAEVATARTGEKKAKSPKVPNFSKLQQRSLWVGLVVLLVAGYFVGMHYFSKATVTLYANGSKADINANFTTDTAVTASSNKTAVLAATGLSVAHNISTTFTPTGTKNLGTKATGNITVTNNSGDDQPLSAGTRFAAPDGKVFRSTAAATAPGATASVGKNGVPAVKAGTVSIPVTANVAGDDYNEAGGQKYTIPGLASDQQALITAQGDQMSGGTTKTVKVVTQDDVDKASAAAVASDKAAGLKDLKAKVSASQRSIDGSLVATPSSVSSNPAVDGQGDQATVTLTITYGLTAVTKADYTSLIHSLEQSQLGANNQIYEDGIGSATVTAGTVTGSKQAFTFATNASGGPKVDVPQLTKDIKGMKYSDAVDHASALPGIVRADVTLWPAWATNVPSVTNHIKVTVKISQD